MIYNNVIYYRSTASNFLTQITELKRVVNDFKTSMKNKPLSLLDLDSRMFILNNSMDSINSYLRISNQINQKYIISPYQKAFSLNLHMLKLTIEESKLLKLIIATMKEIERGNYLEIRNNVLDGQIKKIVMNIEKVEEILEEFLLKKGILNKCKNAIRNDSFGSLYQFKIELLSRFKCDEIKINTDDKVELDA
jgi:hypothetical protein